MTKEEINNIRQGDVVTVRFALNEVLSCEVRGDSVIFCHRSIPFRDILSVERKSFQLGDLVKGPGFSRGVLVAEFKSIINNCLMVTVHASSVGGYLTVAKDLIEFF